MQKYRLSVSGFIALPLPLLFSVPFFTRTPFLSHLLSARHPLVLFPHLSFPCLPLFLHLPLSPLLWIVVGYRCQLCFGQSMDNGMPTSYTIIIGLPGCQHRSSWENYFACQSWTNKKILRNAATWHCGNKSVPSSEIVVIKLKGTFAYIVTARASNGSFINFRWYCSLCLTVMNLHQATFKKIKRKRNVSSSGWSINNTFEEQEMQNYNDAFEPWSGKHLLCQNPTLNHPNKVDAELVCYESFA